MAVTVPTAIAITAALAFAGSAFATDVERHLAEGPGYSVTIATVPFDAARHSLGYRKFEGQKVLWYIDGRNFSGCDGCVPETEIQSIHVRLKGRQYSFPSSAYKALFNPHLGQKFINGSPQVTAISQGMAISFKGGDGAGSYSVKFELDSRVGLVARRMNEQPSPEKEITRKFRLNAGKEPNPTAEPDARKNGARGSP